MFSWKKSAVSRRFKWIRGRVGSRSSRSIDVETGPSASTASVLSRLDSTETSIMSASRNGDATGIQKSSSVENNGLNSSQSEPILGPESKPEDFALFYENGRVVPRAQSAGAIIVVPTSGETNSDRTLNGSDEPSGLRRRKRLNDGIDREENGGSSCGNGNAASLNVANRSDQENAHRGDAMEIVPIVNADQASGVDAIMNRPQYLHAYFDTMYISGTSRRVPVDWRDDNGVWAWIKAFILLAIFCSITFFSIWESIFTAKNSVFHFMDGDGLGHFVDFGYSMFCLFTKVYAVYRFTFLNHEVDNMLNSIQEYEQEYDSQADCHCKYWKWIVLGVCVGTILISVSETFFEGGFEEWTLEAVGWEQSYEFSKQIHIWNYKDIKKQEDHLAWTYGRPENYNGWYGGFSAVSNIASNFQMGTLRDVVLVAVFVIFLIVYGLMKGINDTMQNAPKNDGQACRALQTKREQLWKKYRRVKLVIAALNIAFDVLLILLHVDNLLLYGYFASLCMERKDVAAIVYFHYAFNLVKAELTYLMAVRISAQNVILRTWLRNWGRHTGKIEVDGEEFDVGLLIDEIDHDAMGIGSGIFQITPDFHVKFITISWALVLFLADEKRKKEE